MLKTRDLLAFGEIMHTNASQTIYKKGDAGNKMFIVLEGIFGVYETSEIRDENKICQKKVGSFFGELSAIAQIERNNTVISECDGILLSIHSDNFLQLLKSDSETSIMLLNTLSEQVNVALEKARRCGANISKFSQEPRNAKFARAEENYKTLKELAGELKILNSLIV